VLGAVDDAGKKVQIQLSCITVRYLTPRCPRLAQKGLNVTLASGAA
jgi:hypothetical protein